MRNPDPPKFSDYIPLSEWCPIQDRLAAACRMEIDVLDEAGRALCPPSGRTRFRQLVESSPKAQEGIRESRLALFRAAGEAGRCIVTYSFTRRLKFAVPIFIDALHLATVTGGGVLEVPWEPEAVRRLALELDLEPEELVRAAQEIEVVPRQVLQVTGELIAELLGLILRSRQAQRESLQRAEQLQRMNELAQTMSATLDLSRVLQAVAYAVFNLLDVTASFVALLDETQGVLTFKAACGLSEVTVREARLALGQGLMGYVAATGQEVIVEDMQSDPRNAYPEIDARENLRSMVAVPLVSGDRVIGVVGAYDAVPHKFSEEDARLLHSCAHHAAIAVANARLFEEREQALRSLSWAYRTLAETQEHLVRSEQMATIGQLAAGIAHEIAKPLTSIRGLAYAIARRGDRVPLQEMRDWAGIIVQETHRLEEIIQEVQDYARPRPYHLEPVPLAEFLDEVIAFSRFDTDLQRIGIEKDYTAQPVAILSRDKMKQVLLNLFQNAAQAIENPSQGRIVASLGEEGKWAVIKVSDNGPGIPPEAREAIWDPFYTTKEEGTGLGLPICRQIVVEGHNGYLEMSSEVGKGTTFTIYLPKA